MAETLGPGALFRIGGKNYEFEGTAPTPFNPQELYIVGRVDPDIPINDGILHQSFTMDQMQRDAVRVGPFGETFPYSKFAKERRAWQGILGSDFDIPHPPTELVDVLERAKKSGIDCYVPHFMPKITINEEGFEKDGNTQRFPDSWVNLGNLFWTQANANKIYGDPLNMPGSWILFDTTATKKLDSETHPTYYKDSLGRIIGKSRSGNESRIRLREETITKSIFSNIAKELSVEPESVRFPWAVENMLMLNIFHKDLQEAPLRERYNDTHEGFNEIRRLAGQYWDSPVFDIRTLSKTDHNFDLGFRTVIIFDQK